MELRLELKLKLCMELHCSEIIIMKQWRKTADFERNGTIQNENGVNNES